MGLVYLAEREATDFKQTVALKLIRAGFMDPGLEERFRGERRILARLEHPGIARLIDGGVTEAGQPYYAMEFVEGVDVLTWCRERQPDLDQRLHLFRRICEPVRYAHQQLVVHRDLKPSNVMVDESGRVRLLDFGVAKLLDVGDGEADARTSAWVTPNYAAPEQVRGAGAATPADIYALGVILYEMLTDRLPFDFGSKSPAEIERTLETTVPDRPSDVAPQRLRSSLKGDLDVIVLKALAVEPDRRYATVGELSDDIEAYLGGHPIRARPASASYRLSKFVGRNRVAVAAALLVLVSLVSGIGATLWQARTAALERDRAEGEAAKAARVSGLMLDIFRLSDPTETLGRHRDRPRDLGCRH